MKIIIITEGSGEIGFGHITRCMSLYQAFSAKGLSVKFIVNGDESVTSLLEETDHSIFNWLKNPDKLFKILDDIDILVIDSYLADQELYMKLAELVSLGVYIDDNMRIEYPKGIVINGSINAEKLDYPLSKGVNYLLGSRYIPLRREFWDVPDKKINATPKNVMVTFGGDNLRNLTPKILESLKNNFNHFNMIVVIGRGFNKISEIEDIEDDDTELIYYPDAKGMLEIMLRSDIAISAGGQTLYELARVGLPTIAVGVAFNQKHNVENWMKVGFIEFAGFWEDEDLYDNVLNKLDRLKDYDTRLEKNRSGRDSVDGKGANYIVKYCLNSYYKDKLSVRTAESHDIHNIYELSNDVDVRQNSFNTDKISYETHEKWFNRILEDPDTVLLVIEIMNNLAGQVRFSIEGSEATISISVDKKYRALKLGVTMLEESINYLKSINPFIKIISAYIKHENLVSIRFFENSGFIFEENVEMDGHDALKYVYRIGD